MKKLLCAICVCAVMVSGTGALAADTDKAAPNGKEAAVALSSVMSLENAMAYAAQNHPGVKAAEANIDQLKVAQQEGRVVRYNAQHMSGSGMPMAMQSSIYTYETSMARRGLVYDIATANLAIAEKALEKTQKSVALGVKGAFYQFTTVQEKEALYQRALSAAEERYEYAELKLEQGVISQLELDQVALSVEQARMQLKSTENERKVAELELKNAMGIPLETALTVVGKLNFVEMPATTPEEAAELAMENSLDIIQAKQQTYAEQKTFEATEGYYPENTFTYKKAKYTLDAVKHQEESAIEAAKLGVYKAYNSMAAAYNGYALATKSAELAERAYEVAKLQFELGMITATDLEESANRVTEAQLACADALYGVVMGQAAYEFSYTVGALGSY